MEEELWTNIVKMDFAKKYSLIKPVFSEHFPNASATPWKINELRNTIFHGHAIKDATFDGVSIADERTIEKIFVAAQIPSKDLTDFGELIDGPHALAERWAKKLKQLGESLE